MLAEVGSKCILALNHQAAFDDDWNGYGFFFRRVKSELPIRHLSGGAK